MTLSEPNTIIFFISLALAVLALLAALKVPLPGNSDHAVYVALVGYFLLVGSMLI